MTNALVTFTPAQLRVIRSTVARDADDGEFSLFMEACRSYGLDPFRKQICLVVYNKDKPDRRSHAIIVMRDGLRVMASRCGDYRPASDPPEFMTDPDLVGPTNPHGLIVCSVQLWKQDRRGDWFPVRGEAYWDEFAPVKEVWAEDDSGRRRPSGKFTLDPTSPYAKMPRLMLQKCAEAQALRAGWPETFGGVYTEAEMHRAEAEANAAEIVRKYEVEERQRMLGGPGLLMVFDDTARLEKVPIGSAADRIMEFLQSADPKEAYNFGLRNTEALRECWAQCPVDALTIKKEIELRSKDYKPEERAA